MKFVNWLTKCAPTIHDPAPAIPSVEPALGIAGDDDLVQLDPDCGPYELEPMFIAIEYVDAAGNQSRRRITCLSFTPGPNGFLLCANCHERKAYRQFRFDRIQAIIDHDGEVFEPHAFFREVGIEIAEECAGRLRDRQALRTIITDPSLVVLIALARSDKHFHDSEQAVIIEHIEDLIAHWSECNTPFTLAPTDADAIAAKVAQLRPGPAQVRTAFRKMYRGDQRLRDLAFKALKRLVLADGFIHLGEIQFLEMLEELKHTEVETVLRELRDA